MSQARIDLSATSVSRRSLLARAGVASLALAAVGGRGGSLARVAAQPATPAATLSTGGAGAYRFAVGAFDAALLSDGTATFPDPIAILFPTAGAVELDRALRAYGTPEPWSEWLTPFTPLLIETGRERVLIDTGFGNTVAPTAGRLPVSLASLGVTPEDIDIVVLSHGHPDHIGGATDGAGNLRFPNARFLMARAEWEFWTDEAAVTAEVHPGPFRDLQLGFAQTHLPPLRDRIELIEDGAEIAPGITAILAPGHTPGQLVLDIASEGERLFYGADVVAHPLHLTYPEWTTVFDVRPEPTVGTRRRILDLAAVDGALISAYHVPFPGLGRVVAEGDAWRWESAI